MGYKKTENNCVVHIIPLHSLNQKQATQCETIRREAGKCWTAMVNAHVDSRNGTWLGDSDLKAMSRKTYILHSQTVQALSEKLIANVDTARELRNQEKQRLGEPLTKYPYKASEYQTPIWKSEAIRRQNGNIILSNGASREPLILRLPSRYTHSNIRKAELTWRADHYELAITIDTGEINPPLSQRVKTAGVDLGEVNIAAVVTDKGKGIVITGRYLRSPKRLRNKRHAAYDLRIKRCQPNSRRARRLKKRKAQASARFDRQQRDVLHKASRQAVEFCKAEGVAHISIGDVRDIADAPNKGRKQNQRLSQWPHGQMVRYITYKARNYGTSTTQDPENDSTKTCCQCGHILPTAPRGRWYVCPGCGSKHDRDGNGGANICSRKRYGVYGKVHLEKLTYLQPVNLRTGPSSRALDTGQSCLLLAGETQTFQVWECHILASMDGHRIPLRMFHQDEFLAIGHSIGVLATPAAEQGLAHSGRDIHHDLRLRLAIGQHVGDSHHNGAAGRRKPGLAAQRPIRQQVLPDGDGHVLALERLAVRHRIAHIVVEMGQSHEPNLTRPGRASLSRRREANFRRRKAAPSTQPQRERRAWGS